ncbi:MAG TPA: hypothetical protein PLJ00_12900 [Chitinophagales bacterium]|nr:hypothetical protein [Chitinophagales bacterium]HRH54115.1 hypothetical protein [Chitinophagales bacterium]
MRFSHLFALFLAITVNKAKCQDFINYDKEIVVDFLFDGGYDTSRGSEYLLLMDSLKITAMFNENYCSILEYYFYKDEDDYLICDSIYLSSNCERCFEVNLRELLSKKSRRWKKINDSLYISSNNVGSITHYGPPKVTTYWVLKLEIQHSNDNTNSSLYIHAILIDEADYKKNKKLPRYK